MLSVNDGKKIFPNLIKLRNPRPLSSRGNHIIHSELKYDSVILLFWIFRLMCHQKTTVPDITHLNLNQSFLRINLKKKKEGSKTISSAIKTRTPRNMGWKVIIAILKTKIETPKKETPQIKDTFLK